MKQKTKGKSAGRTQYRNPHKTPILLQHRLVLAKVFKNGASKYVYTTGLGDTRQELTNKKVEEIVKRFEKPEYNKTRQVALSLATIAFGIIMTSQNATNFEQ